MNEFQMIKSTLVSIKEYVSMISSLPNESDKNSVIKDFNLQLIGRERKKVISIEIANYLKLENSIFNKYIEEVAKELHIKLEGLHKANSATSEADAYYIYL
ncbi:MULTISPECIES: hypothetical protein [Enterococcus]|uniref:hypothetical protein n=1 Tax=Enterococcus TaxID=1350 RepID=UPI0006B27DD1|nr:MULTISPECIES: hypothetical protein [Enterococcus]MCK6147538.1 hypothetical protein [Enterococcus hirae]MCK6175274.1 hypothetical protein [Enterococcus hirae]NBA19141.1 hypothetical protein [Enterococcus hirae]NBA28469.1 hypothetical protein [Enterococcus hirae]NBA37802.1 hypothetical protein [Enterococcus hirae]